MCIRDSIEPEIEVTVDNQPRRPEELPQPNKPTEGTRMENMMMRMMEQMTKNNDSMNKNMETLKEDGRKSREENQRNIEVLSRSCLLYTSRCV